MVWFCGSNTTFFTRSEDGRWKLDKEQVDVRRQYTLDEIWDLKAPDTNCMVHAADAAKRVGGWDRDCRWLEDWDFFLRLCLEHPGVGATSRRSWSNIGRCTDRAVTGSVRLLRRTAPRAAGAGVPGKEVVAPAPGDRYPPSGGR